MMPAPKSDVNEFVYSFTDYCRGKNERFTERKRRFLRLAVYNFSKRFCAEISAGRGAPAHDKPGTGLMLDGGHPGGSGGG
jgi:hypothetical protein